MPIGGFIVSAIPESKEEIMHRLRKIEGSSIYGSDDKGNIIWVLDTESSDEMEKIVEEIEKTDGVLNVGVAYMHFEDELEKIEKGIIKPKIRFGKKPQK